MASLELNNAAAADTLMQLESNANDTGLTLGALQTMFVHASEYFTVCDLGRLSVTSKTVGNMADKSVAWKLIFERAAIRGAECTMEFVPGVCYKNYTKTTWNGEPGLLECFSNPTYDVLSSVGYKNAAKCLLSKTCVHCGKMAAFANPVAMVRTCVECGESQQSLWIISKSKAKDAFLLSEKDCAALKSASIPYSVSNKPDAKVSTSDILLIQDVMQASYAKYMGADGLAQEFAARKAKAIARFNKKASTDKPQKKRPKIESLSDRPANDLASLRYFFGRSSLPIPSVLGAYGPYLKMTHSTKCRTCNTRGTTADIVIHERLEHNVCSQGRSNDVEPVSCPPAEGVPMTIPVEIKPTDELVQLFANATIEHVSGEKEDENWDGCLSKKFYTTFTFGDCKVAVDCDKFIGTQFDMNSVSLDYQASPGSVPGNLMRLFWGEETGSPFDEASKKRFDMFKAALGLEDTSSSQLVAALIARSIDIQDFLDSYCMDEPSMADYPTIHGAWTLLNACLKSNED